VSKGQDGFSLIEVMLGSAFLAMIALAAANLFMDQRSSLETVDDLSELNVVHQSWAKTLSMSEHCNSFLKMIFPTSSAITAQAVQSLFVCDPDAGKCADDNSLDKGNGFSAYTLGAYEAKELVKVGDYINHKKRWLVAGIEIFSGRTTSGMVPLKITYQRDRKGSGGSISKEIVLNVKMFDGKFVECLDSKEANMISTQNDLCGTLNKDGNRDDGKMAYWDPSTSTCKISGLKECPHLGYSIDGINIDGVINCKKIWNPSDATTIQTMATTTCASLENPVLQFNTTTKRMEILCH
jgi:hypothetical protein